MARRDAAVRHQPVDEEEGGRAQRHGPQAQQHRVRTRGRAAEHRRERHQIRGDGDAYADEERPGDEESRVEHGRFPVRARPVGPPDRVERAVHDEEQPHGYGEHDHDAEPREPRRVGGELLHVDADHPIGDGGIEIERDEPLHLRHHRAEEGQRREQRHHHRERRHEREQRGVGEASRDLRAAIVAPALQHEAKESRKVAKRIGHGVAS